MDEADWNFTEQQAETVYTCEQLRDKQGVKPHSDIILDLFFVPIEGGGGPPGSVREIT